MCIVLKTKFNLHSSNKSRWCYFLLEVLSFLYISCPSFREHSSILFPLLRYACPFLFCVYSTLKSLLPSFSIYLADSFHFLGLPCRITCLSSLTWLSSLSTPSGFCSDLCAPRTCSSFLIFALNHTGLFSYLNLPLERQLLEDSGCILFSITALVVGTWW